MENNNQSTPVKRTPETLAKNTFVILITIFLAINLVLIVFSSAVNTTVLDSGFLEQEFIKYSENYEADEDLKKSLAQLRGIAGFSYFIFYLLVIFSLILILFIFLTAYRDIAMMLVYLSAAAISASVLCYITGILAFKLTVNKLGSESPVLSEEITIDILSEVTAAVKDYAVILLAAGLLLLFLAYISKRMFKFLQHHD